MLTQPDKRLPDCEGIETLPPGTVDHHFLTDKRLPDCEGIETLSLRWILA